MGRSNKAVARVCVCDKAGGTAPVLPAGAGLVGGLSGNPQGKLRRGPCPFDSSEI